MGAILVPQLLQGLGSSRLSCPSSLQDLLRRLLGDNVNIGVIITSVGFYVCMPQFFIAVFLIMGKSQLTQWGYSAGCFASGYWRDLCWVSKCNKGV